MDLRFLLTARFNNFKHVIIFGGGFLVFEYVNERGQKYYLHSTKTKTGRDLYYFSKELNPEKAVDLPENMKIRENLGTGLPFVLKKDKP